MKANEYREEAAKAQPYVNNIKAILGAYGLYNGAYDRLWKMLEAHEIDVRCPGDGTFISSEKWIEIAGWLGRTVERYYSETPAAKAPARPTFRANRYDGPCVLCGNNVPAGIGRILPKDGGQNGYDVLHMAGECQKATETPARPASPRRDFSAVAGGYYATISPREDQDYDFWYVKEGRKAGYRFVKRYLGGQGPIRISGPEAIKALETILAEGVDVCGDRFADELGRCRDCGLPLTDEESRARRMGPVCAAK